MEKHTLALIGLVGSSLDVLGALYLAYATCYHWLEAGTPAHHGRAEYSIARTALAIGRPQVAAGHAARYAELIAEHPDAFTDWDRAFTVEIQARVAAALGAPDAAELKTRAYHLADQVADPEAREVVQDRLRLGPWFGLDEEPAAPMVAL